MAELRRLLIEPIRLNTKKGLNRVLTLKREEIHYLNRVLRLRNGDAIEVVDGNGHLWEANLTGVDSIQLVSSFDCPLKEQQLPKPLIGLAVVLPKRGFDDLIRMSCEIGVDIIQPLSSERGILRSDGEGRTSRWNGIIREAVEQSERLWKPELRSLIDVKDWFGQRPTKVVYAIASTRLLRPNDLQSWLNELTQDIDQVWVAIGPEGGWTPKEQSLAKEAGCIEVQLGELIMRTSTAAVSIAQLLVSWRRNNFLCSQ